MYGSLHISICKIDILIVPNNIRAWKIASEYQNNMKNYAKGTSIILRKIFYKIFEIFNFDASFLFISLLHVSAYGLEAYSSDKLNHCEIVNFNSVVN